MRPCFVNWTKPASWSRAKWNETVGNDSSSVDARSLGYIPTGPTVCQTISRVGLPSRLATQTRLSMAVLPISFERHRIIIVDIDGVNVGLVSGGAVGSSVIADLLQTSTLRNVFLRVPGLEARQP